MVQTAEAPAPLSDLPDETRIANDPKAHAQIASLSSLASTPSAELQANNTSIRSSVRKGEVLEFRVTSLYYADAKGEPQREVDSMASNQMTGDRWSLRDVKVTDTRETQPSGYDNGNKPC